MPLARGSAGSESGSLTNRYLHGPSIDQVLAEEDFTAGSTYQDTDWTLADHLGSIRDVADRDGMAATTLKPHVILDAFGNPYDDQVIEVRYAFTGREWDPETGLYYYRARFYDATNGRFISVDPIGFQAGDGNLYRYVGNQSTFLTDPTGQIPIIGPAIVAAALACVAGIADPLYEANQVNDKWKHCFVSCEASRACGSLVTVAAGYLQELINMGWGDQDANQSRLDMISNFEGLRCAGVLSGVPGVGGFIHHCLSETCWDCCSTEFSFWKQSGDDDRMSR